MDTSQCMRGSDWPSNIRVNPSDKERTSFSPIVRAALASILCTDTFSGSTVASFFNMSNRIAIGTDMRPNSEYHNIARN